MATPCVSGVCALILQANPSLTPLQLRDILQNTAEHRIPSVKGGFRSDAQSSDPNYDPGSGWGEADAYAACKEALNSTSGVQVVQVNRPVPNTGAGTITVGWITQREYPFQGFDVFRAPDVNGAPGAFAQINGLRIAPSGHSSLQGASNRTPDVVTFDLCAAVRKAIIRHEHEVAPRFRLDAPSEGIRVRADPKRSAQILDNLLNNALKFSPAGASVDVAVTLVGSEAQVRVEDYGIGVAAEDRERMFAAYYRTPRAWGVPGSGLGLHISRRLAEQQGGHLWLDDSTDVGSVFALSLPVAG